MAEVLIPRRWIFRLVFPLLVGLILFVNLLPFNIQTEGWAGPDLILALAMCWGLRRPDFLPPLLAGAVLLTADLILDQPPGLWAGLVVLALELLRARNQLWRDLPFPAEWAVISAIMAVLVVANWLVLALFMVPQATIGLYLIQLIATILADPLVVAFSAFVLGVRKIAPGEVNEQGRLL